MHRAFLFSLALAACAGDKTPADDTSTEDTDVDETAEPEALSDYASGQYRATSFALGEELGVGLDVNGDGVADNKLPAVLNLAAPLVGQPIRANEINETLAADLASGELVVLADLLHERAVLRLDILLGQLDGEALSVDPLSYDGDTPRSRLEGAFTAQETFVVTADRVELPVPILTDEPPVLIPLEMVTLEGTATAEGTVGLLGGAIPVDDFVDQVVDALVPTGEDYDEATYGMPRPEFIEFVRDFANEPSVSDIELASGGRGVSAAVTFEAAPASW